MIIFLFIILLILYAYMYEFIFYFMIHSNVFFIILFNFLILNKKLLFLKTIILTIINFYS